MPSVQPRESVGAAARLNGALFQTIGDESRPALVEARLAEAITSGVLAAGERLPSETDLAESFGVSPTSVREALSSLRGRGLIVTRRGRGGGSFVDESVDPVGFARTILESASRTGLRDLVLHYVTIAGGCMRMGAQRGAPEEFDYLRRRLEVIDPDRVPQWRGAIDEVVTELGALSQSPRLTHELMLRHLELSPLLRLLDVDRDYRRAEKAAVARLIEVMAEGDADGAFAASERSGKQMLARLNALRTG